jgi:disulfide bond formation protein DsbB
MCIFGSYFAGRQIWLQHLPEDLVPACGPGFPYIRDNFPFIDLLDFLLVGDGNCAEVQFRFLGIFSIAEMSIIAFFGLFSVCLFTAFRQQATD